MIKNVIFDMGGVLIDLDVRAMINEFATLVASPASTASIKEADMLGNGGDSPLHEYELGNISTDEFLDSILYSCKPGTSREDVRRATFAILRDLPKHRLNAITSLRAKGYRVYLLSNIQDMHWEYINELMGGWELFFDAIFLSQRMHLTKPDPKIYSTLQEATGILPEETLYIDDVAANVAGGAAAGWHAVQATGDEWLPIVAALPKLE